jgi:hypothetical protein
MFYRLICSCYVLAIEYSGIKYYICDLFQFSYVLEPSLSNMSGNAAWAIPQFSCHAGYKVMASLCISRLPTEFTSPASLAEFEKVKDAWLLKTNNHFQLDDSLVYMRLPTHFLPSREDRAKMARLKQQIPGGEENSLSPSGSFEPVDEVLDDAPRLGDMLLSEVVK